MKIFSGKSLKRFQHSWRKRPLTPLGASILISFFSSGTFKLFEPQHEISNNVVCATSKASDQSFASRLNIK